MASKESFDSEALSSKDLARLAFSSKSQLVMELSLLRLGKREKKKTYFNEEYPEYDEMLEMIEFESVERIHSNILEMKWKTKKEMEGVAMMIYEKATLRPELSLKFAQLIKKLEDEEIIEDDDTMKFQAAFDGHFLNLIYNVATFNEIDAQPSVNKTQKRRKDIGKSVGAFLGNLYNCYVYTLASIMEVAKLLKKKKSPRNMIFLESLLSTMSVRMSQENVSIDMINDMIERYKPSKEESEFYNPDSETISNFCGFLSDIKENHFKFYDDYQAFEKISKDSNEVQIGCFFQDAYTNEECLNVYRDIALNIHCVHPALLQSQLKDEFRKVIEKLDAKKLKYDRESASKFDHLGNMIVQFYTVGLIEDDLVESYLNALKGSKMPKKFFRWIFLEVLKKYEGSKMSDYFQYFRTICEEMPEFKSNIICVQGYLHNRGVRKSTVSKRERIFETGAAAQPDLREFSVKRIKNHSPFKCEERASCHFAALRGIDLLTNHIGSRFYNKNVIDICSKITKKMLNIPSETRICDNFERELRVYLPYFQNDIEPGMKVANFTNLLISFYDDGILRFKIVSKWMEQLYEVVKTQKHKFHVNYMEIYLPSFERISKNFMRDDPNSWLIHSNFVDSCEFATSKFEDYTKFTELIERFKKSSEFTNLSELKKVKIPNDKIALKQVTKFMIDFYINEKPNALFIASLYVVLSDQYHPQLDKNLLRSEFQDAMCLKLGYICARDSGITSKVHQDGQHAIDLIRALCMKTQITRLGLANFFSTMGEMLVKYPFPVRALLSQATVKLSNFFIGAKPIPPKVEKLLMELGRKVIKSLDVDPRECMKAKDILQAFKDIMDDSKEKKKTEEEEQWKRLKMLASPAAIARKKVLPVPKAKEVNEINKRKEITASSSRNSSISNISTESSSKINNIEEKLTVSNEITKNINSVSTNQPKILLEDVADFTEFCECFDSIKPKTSKDDEQFFDSNFVSTIKFTKKEQVSDFASKFIERVLDNKTPLLFFIQSAIKIGNSLQFAFKTKNQNISFRKVLVDEIFSTFSCEKILVEFMCELYNNNFVNKTSMIAFVEKFKTQNPKNLILLQIFIRICGLKLANQGDKQQLVQIRNIAKSFKTVEDIDDGLKFIAQDLSSSLSSVISLMENGQLKIQNTTIHDLEESLKDEEFSAIVNFIKNSNETPERIAEDLIRKSYKSPQISAKAASTFDGRVKHLLIQKIQSSLNDVPEISVTTVEFKNFVEFLADLYNLDILRNEFINWCIEIFLKSTNEEISCQCIKIMFEKCGNKMETTNKSKMDIYFRFFEAIKVANEDSIRAEYFTKIVILRARNWKIIQISEHYYEDFLMLFSINDANVGEIVEILKPDDEEMKKFIQILWKIILKEAPHPSRAILCEEISKSCGNFSQKLTIFLTARWKTFRSLDTEFFNEDVKQRLGKVITFVAEIYNKNLITDDMLEMWIDTKLIVRIPSEFVGRIFSVLGCCKRLEQNRNIRLKSLARNIENIYYDDMDERFSIIVGDLNILQKNSPIRNVFEIL